MTLPISFTNIKLCGIANDRTSGTIADGYLSFTDNGNLSQVQFISSGRTWEYNFLVLGV